MSGRAVLVTGGAAGIGWATARRFAAAGNHVMIADIDGERASARAAELGAAHRAVRVDLSSGADAATMIDAAFRAFGRLDVLINNAGRIDTSGTSIIDQPTPAFRGMFALNLEGIITSTEAAARIMRAQGGGAIVNVASGAALRAIPLRNAYSASKAAVVAATQSLAKRFAEDGIQINAIAPGYTRTELVDALIANGRVDPTKAVQRIPLGRMGTPEEMAEAVFFLASPSGRAMVGGLLLVDGGGQAYGGSEDAGIARGAPPKSPPPGAPVVALAVTESNLGSTIARTIEANGALLNPITSVAVAHSDPVAVDREFAEIVAKHGRIDALVTDVCTTPDTVAAGLDGPLTAVFHLAQAAGRRMLHQGFGAICNITTSGGGLAEPTTSAAIAMFTRSMACEWGGSGVRANALSVGALDGNGGVTSKEAADTVQFLISPAASYITGTVISLDAGRANC